MAEGGDTPIVPGRGKNGKPFKEGNTDENGDYKIGRGRTSVHTRFAVGDDRKRGRRPKGTRNLQTDFAEELAELIEVTERGKKPRKITKQRGVVKSVVARAMKSSDRAAEIALRHANERDARAGQLRLTDREILERWHAQRAAVIPGSVNDDADRDGSEEQAEPPATAGDDGQG